MKSVYVNYEGHEYRVTGIPFAAEKPSWGYSGGEPGMDAGIEDMEIWLVIGDREWHIPNPSKDFSNKIEELVLAVLDNQ